MAEDIPDEHEVSRHIDSPHKWKLEEQEFVEASLFEFPSGQSESLVWRKYAPDLATVHNLGCERQQTKRVTKPSWTYVGAITASVASIRAIQTTAGHGFTVEHAPEEGIWHAHVSIRAGAGGAPNKAHKMDLKEHLRCVFSALEAHSCA